MSAVFVHDAATVLSGPNALEDLAGLAARRGIKRVMVCTSRSYAEGPTRERLNEAFGSHLVAFFPGALPSVPDDVVGLGVDQVQESEPDLLVGVGGGSAIDTAKAISLCAAEGLDWESMRVQYVPGSGLSIPDLVRRKVPVAAISTTPSGAEGTASISVNVTRLGRKVTMLDDACRPGLVAHDTSLSQHVPRRVMGSAAMNALANALEVSYAIGTQWYTASRGFAAARLVARGLDLLTVGEASGAAELLLAGGYMAVVEFDSHGAIATPRAGVIHAVAHALSGRYPVAHGDCYSALLGAGLRYNQQAALPLIQEFGIAIGARSATPTVGDITGRIRDLQEQLSLPVGLDDLGIDPSEFPTIAADALTMFALLGNPRPVLDVAAVIDLLEDAR